MSSHESDGFDPLLAFDSDDPQFARGFECGRIWTLLTTEGAEVLGGQPFHATNVEMVLRMVEAAGAELTAEFTDDDAWMVLR